jgi:hypothetical protein
MDMANMSLQEMVDGGTLRSDEYRRMVIPTYNRTLKKFEAPSPQAKWRGPWTSNRHPRSSCPTRSGPSTSKAATPKPSPPTTKNSSGRPSLFGALDADRTPQEREQISDAFYDSLRKKVAADPATAACH